METETVYFILDILIMIIIIINTIMIYQNNKRMDKINEKLKALKSMVNVTKEE